MLIIIGRFTLREALGVKMRQNIAYNIKKSGLLESVCVARLHFIDNGCRYHTAIQKEIKESNRYTKTSNISQRYEVRSQVIYEKIIGKNVRKLNNFIY